MADGVAGSIVEGLRATSPTEGVAVVLGLAYVVLVARHSRWGWVAGGLSSALFAWLFTESRLPMQALLQVYYVVMAVYGWRHWSRGGQDEQVTRIPWRFHAAGIAASLVLGFAVAGLLAAETRAASPYLDSLTTTISLFATWLIARKVLENWLYWIVVDSLQAVLFASQGLWFTALLFVLYLGIGAAGYLSWRRSFRRQFTP
jgi:nicotinamide mononucleotide transporter